MAVYDQYDKKQIADEYHKSYYAISLYASENIPEIKAELESAKTGQQYLLSQMVDNASVVGQLKKDLDETKEALRLEILYRENKEVIFIQMIP